MKLTIAIGMMLNGGGWMARVRSAAAALGQGATKTTTGMANEEVPDTGVAAAGPGTAGVATAFPRRVEPLQVVKENIERRFQARMWAALIWT